MNNGLKKESFESIGKRIDEAVRISKSVKNFKEGWAKLKEIQEELKQFEADEAIKDQLWSPLKESFDRLKKRETEYFKTLKVKQEENFKKLKPILDEGIAFSVSEQNIKLAWNKLVDVQRQFKGLSLPKDKNYLLWDTLREAFDALKAREENLFEEQKEDWEKHHALLKEKVDQAREIAHHDTYFKDAWKKINDIKAEFSIIKTEKSKQEALLKELSAHMQVLTKRQNERKKEIEKIKEAGFDKLNKLCNRALNEAKTNKNLKELFTRLKNWQKDIFSASRYLDSKEEQATLKAKIDEAFTIYKQRQEEYFVSKREEWLRNQKEFLEKMKEKKERLETVTIPKILKNIDHSKEYLSKIEAEFQMLTPSDEKYDFLENKIEKVKNEIIEREASIEDIKKKITGIEKTILDVTQKITK